MFILCVCEFHRTTFDLAKSVDGVMILEQESDTFNLTLFSGETPQVAVHCVLHTFSLLVCRYVYTVPVSRLLHICACTVRIYMHA